MRTWCSHASRAASAGRAPAGHASLPRAETGGRVTGHPLSGERSCCRHCQSPGLSRSSTLPWDQIHLPKSSVSAVISPVLLLSVPGYKGPKTNLSFPGVLITTASEPQIQPGPKMQSLCPNLDLRSHVPALDCSSHLQPPRPGCVCSAGDEGRRHATGTQRETRHSGCKGRAVQAAVLTCYSAHACAGPLALLPSTAFLPENSWP